MGEPVAKLEPKPDLPDREELEASRRQISPGNPHKYSFILSSPARTWEGDAEFMVHRPTRAEMSMVSAHRAAGMTSGGLYARDLMDMYDGRYIEIEAWLSTMLDEAPDCWWTRDLEGKPLDKKDRGITFDRVYNEDLDAVWKKVVPYLESFGIKLYIPAEVPPDPTG
jgi:hypothetical protein